MRFSLPARALGPAAVVLVAALTLRPVPAETLDHVISRENPKFHATQTVLTVGRDGKVYLASNDNPGYVLRQGLDGTAKEGGEVVYALHNCAVNAAGIIATANGHFSHSVNLYSPTFEKQATVADFLVNDAVGWDAPARVEVGAGGDFYGVDQHRNRIVRITPAGKILTTYPLRHESEDAKEWGRLVDFRVCEKAQAFYWAANGNRIRCVGFDGKTRWSIPAAVGGDPWSGWSGGFDVDDDGNLYLLENTADTVRRFAPDGQPAGEVKLQMGARKGRVAALRLAGDAFVVQRPDPVELLQVYARADGALRQVVRAAAERIRVTLPDGPWPAGGTVPVGVTYEGSIQEFAVRRWWRLMLSPLGVGAAAAEATSLEHREDGSVFVPSALAGLYQLRVEGPAPEYRVRAVIEVRKPDAKGTVSVFTPNNRVWFGRGEAITVNVQLRRGADSAPVTMPLWLTGGPGVRRQIASVGFGADGAPADAQSLLGATVTVPAELTAQLPPGRYRLATESAFTDVPQYLVLDDGTDAAWPFRVTQYGDYGITFPVKDVWEFADATDAHLDRCERLGLNQFVDRANWQFPLDFENSASGRPLLRALQERLAKDPAGTAPEKAEFGFAHYATMGGYSAEGLREMPLLVNMDGGLPLGTGFDARKPEQFTENIRRHTEALKPFPSFYGWAWVANWWIYEDARRYASPEERAAYDVAYKRAQETGAWDPILDTVSARAIGWQVEAQDFFNKTLREVAPERRTASSGPYRRPDTYAPTSFANVDEVDVHYQCEQITTPNWVPHGVDFMKLPGKPAWVHPEVWNDPGTGEQILPVLWQAVMRGADGIGCSGNIPNWGAQPADARIAYAGTQSIFRGLFQAVRPYGPWLTTLENADPIAIVVSPRLLRIDRWSGLGGLYFSRLFEAYQSCLYAHRPARYVYPEHLARTPLTGFRAVLVVGQTVEFDPELLAALRGAQKAGVPVFADGTCRAELVKEFKPLGLTFDFVEHSHPMNNDTVYWSYPERFVANAAVLAKALEPAVPPLAECAEPEVLLSERRNGDGRFLFVVNNAHCPLDPGVLWRYTLGIATRMPLVVPVRLNLQQDDVVYDVLARREVEPADATVSADLRYGQARLYAILPRRLERVALTAPASAPTGAKLACEVRIQGAWRRPIPASVPVHFRAWADSGRVLLAEQFLAVPAAGATVTLTVPADPYSEYVHLEATELFSGRSARADVRVRDWQPQLGSKGAVVFGDPSAWRPALPPATDLFGPHLRDLAVSTDGKTAAITAMDWDRNLYLVDTANGRLRKRDRLGQYWTFAPQAAGNGFAVQACDLRSAPGYYLYRLAADGAVRDRCALPAAAGRLSFWFVPGMVQDRMNNFAASPGGTFAAGCGNLGLAVWDADGKLLWSRDWSQETRRTMPLAALGEDTLVHASGMTVTAADATTGTERWRVTLAPTGEVQGLVAEGAGGLVVARTTYEGGRVFVLRGGKVVAAFPTPADEVVIVPQGRGDAWRFVALVTGSQVKVYVIDTRHAAGTFTGDSPLHGLRASPDGQRLAVGSELGTLSVLNAHDAAEFHRRDLGALPVAAWLPGAAGKCDLLAATWRGTVHRFSPTLDERWQVRLAGDVDDIRPRLLAARDVPTRQPGVWTNSAPAALPLAQNLLAANSALVRFKLGDGAVEPQQKTDLLFDGQATPPEKPWLPWYEIGMIDSGWKGSFSLEIDTFRRQLRVSAITFVEDPARPESWLRDARLEYWDAVGSRWLFAQYLTADAAVHTHVLAKPIEAARFRLSRPDGAGWPQGNLRLAELVFHGDEIGLSHPDAQANRPAAVLFDEREEDLRCLLNGEAQSAYLYGDAASGGMCLKVGADKLANAAFQPVFGHAVPHWDFELAENPAPGQYRWLQFAAKGLAPETRGLTVRIGAEFPGPAFWLDLGEGVKTDQGVLVRTALAPQSPQAWQRYRVDLWALLQKDGKAAPRLRSLALGTVGGPGAFDQIVLGRSAADLPPLTTSPAP